MNSKLVFKSLAFGGVSAVAVVLSACSNGNSTPPGTGYFRAVNGVTDSSSMNVDLASVGTASAIAYADSSGVTTIPIGSYDATIKPTSNSTQNYKVTGVSIDNDSVSTVLTYGSVASATASGFKAEESIGAPANGKFAVQFLHDAYSESLSSATLNFYIVTPGSGISGVTPVTMNFATVPSTSRTEFTIASNGLYQLIITNAAGLRIFDSGTSGVQLLENGANVLQIAAVDRSTSSSSASPVAVVVMDNLGAHFAVAPSS